MSSSSCSATERRSSTSSSSRHRGRVAWRFDGDVDLDVLMRFDEENWTGAHRLEGQRPAVAHSGQAAAPGVGAGACDVSQPLPAHRAASLDVLGSLRLHQSRDDLPRGGKRSISMGSASASSRFRPLIAVESSMARPGQDRRGGVASDLRTCASRREPDVYGLPRPQPHQPEAEQHEGLGAEHREAALGGRLADPDVGALAAARQVKPREQSVLCWQTVTTRPELSWVSVPSCCAPPWPEDASGRSSPPSSEPPSPVVPASASVPASSIAPASGVGRLGAGGGDEEQRGEEHERGERPLHARHLTGCWPPYKGRQPGERARADRSSR